jgi:hypothetical protein
MSRRAVIALYVLSGLLLGAGAFFVAVLLLPWGLAIPAVLGAALIARGFWILRRSRRASNRPTAH